MCDILNLCRVFFRAAVDGDEDTLLIRYNVRVGEDLIFTDDEARADAAAKSPRVPWCLVIGILGRNFDA